MPATKIRSAESVTRPESEPEPAPIEHRSWLPSVAEQAPWYYLGLAAMAGLGVVEWPVAVTIGVIYYWCVGSAWGRDFRLAPALGVATAGRRRVGLRPRRLEGRRRLL